MRSYVIKPNELEAIALFSSDEETRYYLNGVCIESGGPKLALIATDGHRLGTLHADLKTPPDDSFILGSNEIRKALALYKTSAREYKTVKHLLRIKIEKEADALKISVVLIAAVDDVKNSKELATFTGKCIDGVFPDWRRCYVPAPDSGGDYEWSPDSFTQCTGCDAHGPLSMFTTERRKVLA